MTSAALGLRNNLPEQIVRARPLASAGLLSVFSAGLHCSTAVTGLFGLSSASGGFP